jgi:molybdate transport system ATP-binding protein
VSLAATLGLALGALDLDATVDAGEGETLAILGPNGAGKTTLLRSLAGLLALDHGRIELDAEVLDDGTRVFVPPERRSVGVVFQDYLLFPHLSTLENVAFGLRSRGVNRRAARRRAAAALEPVGLAAFAGRKPGELSGGQAQRVALARALATEPRLLLLDEPLAALDPSTRSAVAAELAEVIDAAAVPTVVVTHSYEEAVMFADEVAVMDTGAIVQRGRAADVVEAPASAFVAEFAGINYLKGTAAGTTVRLDSGQTVRTRDPADGAVAVLVAPWDITLALGDSRGDGDSALNHIPVRVERVVVVGNRARVTLGGLVAEVTPESVERLALRPGLNVVAVWKATATRVVARQAS